MGPINKVLSQYPRVKGLGVGAFGEFSTDLEELLELTATARALDSAIKNPGFSGFYPSDPNGHIPVRSSLR